VQRLRFRTQARRDDQRRQLHGCRFRGPFLPSDCFCARHWKREHSGFGKSTTTFAIIVGVVAVYYGILAIWFWNMIPTPLVTG
jgi:hypothetical protein